MPAPLLSFVELVMPVVLSLVLIATVFFIRLPGPSKIVANLLGLFRLEVPVKRAFVVRLILLLSALVLLCVPAFRDYSEFFPADYDIEVFFDDEGINKTLIDYTRKELASIHIAPDWVQRKQDHLRKLNQIVARKVGISEFFQLSGDYVHSKGQNRFVVEKVKGVWQEYRIKEGHGELRHFVEDPKRHRQFRSKFELLSTSDNYIHVSLTDLYLRYTKILRPQFKQFTVVSTSPAGEDVLLFYPQSIVAITKVRFFPVPSIGNTVYCIQAEGLDSLKLVPIGYAVNLAR